MAEKDQNVVTLYPNPCNTLVNLLFNTNENQEVILEVYDAAGHIVRSNSILTSTQHTLDVTAMRQGLYFVAVCDRNKNILQWTKLIKESDF